jgi:hypothetical protein
MPENRPPAAHILIYRPNAYDAQLIAQTRARIRQTRTLLEIPAPRPFLGERHCRPPSNDHGDQ